MIAVMDLESRNDPDLPGVATDDKVPAPVHHQVIACGALLLNDDYSFKGIGLFAESKPEREILTATVDYLDKKQPWIVTYNGRGFDLPVIAARCFRHGIPFRHYYRGRDVRHRYSDTGHFDLMDFISDFGSSRPVPKLDAMAKACGMPGKVGIDGSMVGALFDAGNLDEVNRYCLCDLAQTGGVFLRVQLLRGELSVGEYKVAAQGLLEAIQADPRLEPVAAGINVKRFLLEENGNG